MTPWHESSPSFPSKPLQGPMLWASATTCRLWGSGQLAELHFLICKIGTCLRLTAPFCSFMHRGVSVEAKNVPER